VKTVLKLLNSYGKAITGISHITGGGIYENAPRCLPDGVKMNVDAKKFPQKPIFDLLAAKGDIPLRDMHNTYNMGVGMLLTVDGARADEILRSLKNDGEEAVIVGECAAGETGVTIWS
jgi:phosphoribosylformylglycinamidine cyclo-ligase